MARSINATDHRWVELLLTVTYVMHECGCPCDVVTKCVRAGKFPRTFAEEASGWRTRDTDIRHDCQLIPHFADVSADKFELASAPTCGMPIGGRSLHCTLPQETKRPAWRYSRSWNSRWSRRKNRFCLSRTGNFISKPRVFLVKKNTNCVNRESNLILSLT